MRKTTPARKTLALSRQTIRDLSGAGSSPAFQTMTSTACNTSEGLCSDSYWSYCPATMCNACTA